MTTLTIELPPQQAQTEANMRRWAELLEDRQLARFEGRIETDRHGNILTSPPPAASHGRYQSRIAILLGQLLSEEGVLTECPISTADGVRACDVAWASPKRLKELGDQVCFPHAPEICVEVVSPANSALEIQEKTALYFDAGAKEVWLCSSTGAISFLSAPGSRPMRSSKLCPRFPRQIELQ